MNITIPEYIGQGILELLILTVGGLLVGWITHTYFARKAAIVEVEGEVMKKRLSIYEELYKRLNSLLAEEILPTERINAAFQNICKSGIEVEKQSSIPTLTVMHTAKGFTTTYMELDIYINRHRLYFETEVDKALLLFSNYLAIYRRLQVMFEEQVIASHYSLDDELISYSEDLLMTEISILFQDELSSEVFRVLTSLKKAINTPMRHKRKAQDHSIATFGDDGIIIQYLRPLRIFQQRQQIQQLIAHSVALAIASKISKKRK